MIRWWKCQSEMCGFRFPATERDLPVPKCPWCEGEIAIVAIATDSGAVPAVVNVPVQREVIAILDNIRSANNVGAMFRSADGCGVSHIYVCGMTATPENKKVAKTALDAEKVIPWTQFNDVTAAVAEAQAQGYVVWAIDGHQNAVSLYDTPLPARIAVVMGNENGGVDPAVLESADAIVALPMRGIKQSLNVAVTFGIVCYHLMDGRTEVA